MPWRLHSAYARSSSSLMRSAAQLRRIGLEQQAYFVQLVELLAVQLRRAAVAHEMLLGHEGRTHERRSREARDIGRERGRSARPTTVRRPGLRPTTRSRRTGEPTHPGRSLAWSTPAHQAALPQRSDARAAQNARAHPRANPQAEQRARLEGASACRSARAVRVMFPRPCSAPPGQLRLSSTGGPSRPSSQLTAPQQVYRFYRSGYRIDGSRAGIGRRSPKPPPGAADIPRPQVDSRPGDRGSARCRGRLDPARPDRVVRIAAPAHRSSPALIDQASGRVPPAGRRRRRLRPLRPRSNAAQGDFTRGDSAALFAVVCRMLWS